MSKLNIQEINFIIYNNRSIKLVEQFLPTLDINIVEFLNFENKIKFLRSFFNKGNGVEINENELKITEDDIIYNQEDIKKQTDIILNANKYIKDYPEYEFLIKRGITDDIINKYKIGAGSYITDLNVLKYLGITHHPILSDLFEDGLGSGIILQPLFNTNNDLINCSCRRISNMGKLKYTLACPEFDVWGLDEFKTGDEIWLTEGIFDKMALNENGLKCVTVASATWSTIQLYRLIKKEPKSINIFSDYDYTGLRSSKLLQKIFRFYGIECKIFISKFCKDAAEHFFEKKLTLSDIEEIAVTQEMLDEIGDDTLLNTQTNFLDYLKTRVF